MREDDDNHVWQQKLYILQQHAPPPLAVKCTPLQSSKSSINFPQGEIATYCGCIESDISHSAPRNTALVKVYGDVYHGALSRDDAAKLLSPLGSGNYLLRDCSQGPNQITLVIKFDEEIKNFRLYYDPVQGEHYVGENRFRVLNDLIADGLIHFYVESRGADVMNMLGNREIYERSPYVQERERYYTLQSRRRGLQSLAVPTPVAPLLSPGMPVVQTLERRTHLGMHPRPKLPVSARMVSCRLSKSSDRVADPPDSNSDSNGRAPGTEISEDTPSPDTGVYSSQDDTAPSTLNRGSRLPSESVHEEASSPCILPTSLSSIPTSGNGEFEEEDEGMHTMTTISGKVHNFKQLTFAGPQWCDWCTHFMWGLVQQGVRCQDCGMQAHRKCGENAPRDCIPDMKLMKRVFGVELSSLVLAEHSLVPNVLQRLVTELESRPNALKQEGLYRECGFADHVEELKMLLNKDVQAADLSRYEDANILTGLIKKFFSLLPIPLITFELYNPLIGFMSLPESEEKLRQVKAALRRLPEAHRRTLRFLMAHLKKVVEFQAFNRMSSANLSVIFSQTLMRMPEHGTLSPSSPTGGGGLTLAGMGELMRRVQRENLVINFILDRQGELFC